MKIIMVLKFTQSLKPIVCSHSPLRFFPLITFVVNMMYLQIIYQREALQMPEMIKQKALQLACVQVR